MRLQLHLYCTTKLTRKSLRKNSLCTLLKPVYLSYLDTLQLSPLCGKPSWLLKQLNLCCVVVFLTICKNNLCLEAKKNCTKTNKQKTEELYKKDLQDPDNHNAVITHLEPDILECEVKWALESITMNKASGGDGIPVELFQILKDDAVKVVHSICQQIWKTQQWPQDWKRSVFIPIPKKGDAKECSNYHTIALICLTC